ncbi:ABC transporter permease [Spiroplasma endosymbiont of Dioctria linearis]|uniref:ABC transporter permease n=1 Tax=Spiroplasma endosymbiont of Dioctria linearis TaxID=3066290 RepID=UPI00313BE4A9
MKKVIPGIWIIKYSFKSIIKERSFIIFNGLYLLFSLLIAIYSVFQKNNSSFLLIFDYYVLLTIFIILFILCLRLAQYFYVVKRDDKTLNIIVTQQLSRAKLFSYQFMAFILLMFFNISITYLLINIINMLFLVQVNLFLLRVTTTYFVYAFISCLFLINFFLLISLFANIQVSTIIATLILASSFISNLPYTFLIQGEENKSITFSYKNANTAMSVNEIYDSYNLKNHVLNKKIKYSNLSFEIYNNFIDNQFETDPNSINNNFNNASSIQKRINFWMDLGVVEEKQQIVELNEPTKIIAVNNNTQLSKWKGDEVNLKFELKYRFLTVEELENKIKANFFSKEKEKIIKEFIEFTNFITKVNNNFQDKFYDLFDVFIFLNEKDNIEKNYIKNATKPQEEKMLLKDKDIVEIYQSYFSFSDNKLRLESSKVSNLIQETLFFPTMLSIRILENYFIRYTNNMVIFENSTVIKNENWTKYIKSRNLYNISFQFNFISNMLQNYTYFGGRSYDHIWFEPESSSKIYFNKQDNLFISQPSYAFKINSENKLDSQTYNNFIAPYYYVIFQAMIAIINYYVAKNKFRKLDLTG